MGESKENCVFLASACILLDEVSFQVDYALDVPWYASLPRLETRFYLEQYGGANDVWIGKTLYMAQIIYCRTISPLLNSLELSTRVFTVKKIY